MTIRKKIYKWVFKESLNKGYILNFIVGVIAGIFGLSIVSMIVTISGFYNFYFFIAASFLISWALVDKVDRAVFNLRK